MTNAKRATRKSGKNSPSTQSPKTTENPTGETPKPTLTLALRDGLADADVAQITMPDDLASYLGGFVADENPNLGAFIVQALRGQARRSALDFSIPKLEETIQRALLVIEAMDNKLLVTFEEQMRARGPEYDPQTAVTLCAYHGMALTAAKDLHNQFAAMCSYVRAGLGQGRAVAEPAQRAPA